MDIMGVSSKVTVFVSESSSEMVTIGILETAANFLSILRDTLKVAFLSGSSQQGKALRASVDSNCVAARNFVSPLTSVY